MIVVASAVVGGLLGSLIGFKVGHGTTFVF
jgi:uncharacterized protein YcfJ